MPPRTLHDPTHPVLSTHTHEKKRIQHIMVDGLERLMRIWSVVVLVCLYAHVLICSYAHIHAHAHATTHATTHATAHAHLRRSSRPMFHVRDMQLASSCNHPSF